MACRDCKKQNAMIMVAGGFMIYCPEDRIYHFLTDTCPLDTSKSSGFRRDRRGASRL